MPLSRTNFPLPPPSPGGRTVSHSSHFGPFCKCFNQAWVQEWSHLHMSVQLGTNCQGQEPPCVIREVSISHHLLPQKSAHSAVERQAKALTLAALCNSLPRPEPTDKAPPPPPATGRAPPASSPSGFKALITLRNKLCMLVSGHVHTHAYQK